MAQFHNFGSKTFDYKPKFDSKWIYSDAEGNNSLDYIKKLHKCITDYQKTVSKS